MKLRCEGTNPCSSCQKRGTPCTRPTKASSTTPKTESASPTPVAHSDRGSEMGSIKFLLNGGMDGFMEDFSFPNSANPTHQTKTKSDEQLTPSPSSIPSYNGDPNTGYSMDLSEFGMNRMPDVSVYSAAMQSFFQGPFDAYRNQWQGQPMGHDTQDLMWVWPNGVGMNSCEYQIQPEPPSPLSMALIDALLTVMPKLDLDLKAQHEVSTDVHFIFTPRRIQHFTDLHFKLWFPNGPIMHEPSFVPENVQLPSLAAVIMMGAMYSVDERELRAAKRLLDLVEVLCFSTEVYSAEGDIKRTLEGREILVDRETDWITFQDFQAGYFMCVIQHWAGNALGKSRAMECRYSEVIKVARAIGLTKARHMPEDRIHQDLWIQKECRVRTMCIIWSLDSAFLFFQNFPSRLTFAELDCDLPCDESLWSAKNPFAEPQFRFDRNMTLRQGMEMLFNNGQPSAQVANTKRTTVSSKSPFSVFDMFLLIHVLTALLCVRITLSIPLRQMVDTMGHPPVEDPLIDSIKRALSAWRDHWISVCQETPAEAWPRYGFKKNSYKFWLVAQLLVSKHDQIDANFLLQPKCEQKLERLQLLA